MSKTIQEVLEDFPAWERAFAEDGYVNEDTRVTIKEVFASPDAPILFPKVISRTLREAAEPEFLVTPLLSVVRLDKTRSMEFPAVNAIQAFEVPEGQEYPEQSLAFSKQVEGKVTKKGLKVTFTEEVIADSLWDIVGLHVRAAGRAMARLKEQIALSRFAEAATVVFDNNGSEPDTTGRDITGALNDSLTWDDVVEMAAVLMAEKKAPTDFIMHPLAWALFWKDASFHAGGANVGAAWGLRPQTPGAAVNATTPMGMNAIVSPFVDFTAKTDSTPATTDAFLIDRSDVGVLMVRDDMSTDEWVDLTRDIRAMKMKERYDIVTLGDGEGITVAKNVAIARNYEVTLTNEMA